MAMLMATRLRSCGVTVTVTFAAYRPRVRYWRFISCSARSRAERSKMRASASPISFSAFFSVSVSNSLLPVMSTLLIVGRSWTTTRSTPSCTSSRTSRKKPVAKSALTAAATFSSSIVSPTLIGRYEKTVPASVRCTPSTRMSLTTKGAMASARFAPSASASASSAAPARRADSANVALEQSGEVIEKRQRHQHRQHGHADALTDLEGTVGDGTTLDDLGEIIQQMPTVQQRHRQ